MYDYDKVIGVKKDFDSIYVIGDIHGRIPYIFDGLTEEASNSKVAVILLGDVGANFYLDKRDTKFKKKLNDIGVRFYCLRGNHEARPEDIEGMIKAYDEYTENVVYYQPEYENILYLIDGQEYFFNGLSCLALGGAYSVDKWYRLEKGWTWFPNEQLNSEERQVISKEVNGNFYNIILSHTCPYSWQPTDLFLDVVDQNTVDNSTEMWLEDIAKDTQWDKWLFGHFHETRKIDEHRVMMLSDDILLDLIEWYDIYLK